MVPLPLFSCVPNFLELRYGELPRIPILRTPVNKGMKRKDRGCYPPARLPNDSAYRLRKKQSIHNPRNRS
jgi:hypothetical protein